MKLIVAKAYVPANSCQRENNPNIYPTVMLVLYVGTDSMAAGNDIYQRLLQAPESAPSSEDSRSASVPAFGRTTDLHAMMAAPYAGAALPRRFAALTNPDRLDSKAVQQFQFNQLYKHYTSPILKFEVCLENCGPT